MYNKLSTNLKNLIERNNLTQTELGKLLNTSQQNVSRWVSGNYEPSIETILKLCLILDTDPNDLLGYDEIGEDVKQNCKFKK